MFSRLRTTSRWLPDLHLRKTASQRTRTRLFTGLSSDKSTLVYTTSPLLSQNNSLHVTSRLSTQDTSQVQKSVDTEEGPITSEETFASLLRHSAFMQIGNPVGKVNGSILLGGGDSKFFITFLLELGYLYLT